MLYQELGSTAACVLRGVKDTSSFLTILSDAEDKSPRLYFGDSWFGSVKAAIAVVKAGHHAYFMIKKTHVKSPKNYLEEKMKDFPGSICLCT